VILSRCARSKPIVGPSSLNGTDAINAGCSRHLTPPISKDGVKSSGSFPGGKESARIKGTTTRKVSPREGHSGRRQGTASLPCFYRCWHRLQIAPSKGPVFGEWEAVLFDPFVGVLNKPSVLRRPSTALFGLDRFAQGVVAGACSVATAQHRTELRFRFNSA
jgi:hypothetical protein